MRGINSEVFLIQRLGTRPPNETNYKNLKSLFVTQKAFFHLNIKFYVLYYYLILHFLIRERTALNRFDLTSLI